MRITIRIDDALYREVKQRAATGAGGLMPGVDLSSNAPLAEVVHDETPLDAMR
ncbi:MAG: hypothetical protein U1D00_32045 [Mycobacterium sp.]|nr:hypothetical protein [Mycobacterium sp.]